MGFNCKEFNTNIINWYELNEQSKVLLIGDSIELTEFLKQKVNFVKNHFRNELVQNIELFNYIIIYGIEKQEIDLIGLINNNLEEDGKLLIIGNNDYGINNWSKYNYEKGSDCGVLELEKDRTRKCQITKIKNKLQENNINTNTFYVFPNYLTTELILNEKTQIDRGYIEKYCPDIIQEEVKVFDEIKVLKSIVKNNPEIVEFFANSFFIEASKKQIETQVKYVSYNNIRKPEYRLITIIKEDIVEKVPAHEQAKSHIENMKNNIQILNGKIELLDYEKDGKICSKLIKNNKTLDRIIYKNHENIDEVIKIFDELKSDLIKNTVEYNEEILKYLPEGTEKYKELLPQLHYLKDAFWDMIPKNCFYIDGKYVFFDQEWKQEYLPAEFILYRGIINCYDLVRNIDVNNLYEKLGISEYIEIFKTLDNSIREQIIDKNVYEQIYQKSNIKAVDNLINENKIYEENNIKQNNYISFIEEQLESVRIDNSKKQEYIEELENKIIVLEKNQRKIFRKR